MSGYINTVWMMLKVLMAFSIIYIIIPARVVKFEKESNGLLDKLFISLVHSNLVIIGLVHLLVSLKFYETFSLLFCCIAVCTVVIWLKNKATYNSISEFGMKLVVHLMEILDGSQEFRRNLKQRYKTLLLNGISSLHIITIDFFRKPFGGILAAIVLAIAAYIRFNHAFIHTYLGSADAYVHLTWSKGLNQNKIYVDGIYPYGYEAIISALNRLFFLDPFIIVRFIGPLGGFLIVLSIYYVLRKNYSANLMLAWLAIFIYVAGAGLPGNVWRQISALPEEYASIFILLGIHFLNLYFRLEKNKYLFLAAECLALTAVIHPYSMVYLGIGYFITCIFYIKKLFNLQIFKRVSLGLTVSMALGFIPIGTGYIFGGSFYKNSIDFITQSARLNGGTSVQKPELAFHEVNPVLQSFLVCAFLMLLFYLIYLICSRKKSILSDRFDLVILLAALVSYTLYRAQYLGLPVLMTEERLGIFASLFIPLVLVLPLKILELLVSRNMLKRILKLSLVCTAVIAVLLLPAPSFAVPKGDRFEYDEAANAYLKIKDNYEIFNWTIISTTEQYDQCIGYGWHYNLWEFVELVTEKKEKLKIPTDNIFIFVEKVPLGSNTMVSEADARKPFPTISGQLVEYYSNTESRRILEAKMYFWAEDYMKRNSNMSVFFENNDMKIYIIKQDKKNQVNLLK